MAGGFGWTGTAGAIFQFGRIELFDSLVFERGEIGRALIIQTDDS